MTVQVGLCHTATVRQEANNLNQHEDTIIEVQARRSVQKAKWPNSRQTQPNCPKGEVFIGKVPIIRTHFMSYYYAQQKQSASARQLHEQDHSHKYTIHIHSRPINHLW